MAGYGWAVYGPWKGGIQIVNGTGNNGDLLSYFAKTPDNGWGFRIEGVSRPTTKKQKTGMNLYLGIEDAGSKTEFTQELKQVFLKGE